LGEALHAVVVLVGRVQVRVGPELLLTPVDLGILLGPGTPGSELVVDRPLLGLAVLVIVEGDDVVDARLEALQDGPVRARGLELLLMEVEHELDTFPAGSPADPTDRTP